MPSERRERREGRSAANKKTFKQWENVIGTPPLPVQLQRELIRPEAIGTSVAAGYGDNKEGKKLLW